MQGEPRGSEGSNPLFARFKVGLETPMVGRFYGENKRLIFSPPLAYDVLSGGCVLFGILIGITMWIDIPLLDVFSPFKIAAWFVATAGAWAFLSTERMVIDLRQRTYVRREGTGPFKRTIRGSLSDIDAIVLIASQYLFGAVPGTNHIIYRLVMHWKAARAPLLVVARFDTHLSHMQPTSGGNQVVLALGMRYASEMKVPFFDNSYFLSPDPLRPV